MIFVLLSFAFYKSNLISYHSLRVEPPSGELKSSNHRGELIRVTTASRRIYSSSAAATKRAGVQQKNGTFGGCMRVYMIIIRKYLGGEMISKVEIWGNLYMPLLSYTFSIKYIFVNIYIFLFTFQYNAIDWTMLLTKKSKTFISDSVQLCRRVLTLFVVFLIKKNGPRCFAWPEARSCWELLKINDIYIYSWIMSFSYRVFVFLRIYINNIKINHFHTKDDISTSLIIFAYFKSLNPSDHEPLS